MPPTSEDTRKQSNMNFNRSEISDSLTSGYSTRNSSQSSEENLKIPKLHGCEKGKIVLEYASNRSRRECFDLNSDTDRKSTENSSDENDENRCPWSPIATKNELEPHKEWYNRLLAFREEYRRGERGSLPPYPPQPPPSSFISASQATHVNPFDEDHYVKQRNNKMYTHRFQPSDFRIIPPPHVFVDMIRTLAPHQYIDLTYAIAGSILLSLGVRIPECFPPLPPKIEPISKWEEECRTDESDVSSQSSSDGEYSDDSVTTKMEKRKAKAENMKRRSARRVKILNKAEGFYDGEQTSFPHRMTEAERKKRAIEHENNYKRRTLNNFIPSYPNPTFRPPFVNPSLPSIQSNGSFSIPIFWNPIMPYIFAAIPPQFLYNATTPPNVPLTPSPSLTMPSDQSSPTDNDGKQQIVEDAGTTDSSREMHIQPSNFETRMELSPNSMQRIIETGLKNEEQN